MLQPLFRVFSLQFVVNGFKFKASSANYKLSSTNYKAKGTLHDGRYLHTLPYIGRVTVMVVPSFSLLFKAMVP